MVPLIILFNLCVLLYAQPNGNSNPNQPPKFAHGLSFADGSSFGFEISEFDIQNDQNNREFNFFMNHAFTQTQQW